MGIVTTSPNAMSRSAEEKARRGSVFNPRPMGVGTGFVELILNSVARSAARTVRKYGNS